MGFHKYTACEREKNILELFEKRIISMWTGIVVLAVCRCRVGLFNPAFCHNEKNRIEFHAPPPHLGQNFERKKFWLNPIIRFLDPPPIFAVGTNNRRGGVQKSQSFVFVLKLFLGRF